MSSPNTKLLFVYGTLKRGFCNHPFLAGQQFVGPGRTVPGYRLYNVGGYPGMVAAGDDRLGVSGEIWSVDERCLAEIDYLEGVDQGLYRREPVALLGPFDQEVVETYIYTGGIDGYPSAGNQWQE